MACGNKISIQQLQTLKKAEPFDFFIADHAGVRCPSPEVVIMKIVNHIIPEFTAEVQGKHRNLKIRMIADNKRRWFKGRALVKRVEDPDIQTRDGLSLFNKKTCRNS